MSGGLVRPPRRTEADADVAARQDAHRLAAVLRDCAAAGIRRRCLLLRLSCLPAELRRPHHVRLAAEALEPLLSADRAQRFMLPNGDIAMLWRGSAEALLEAGRRAALHMFADVDAALPALEELWRLFALPEGCDALGDLVAASLRDPAPPSAAALPREPLDPLALTGLEAALAQADVARFARRRAVCRHGADGRLRLAWEGRYLAVDDLCDDLAPGRAARAEPWLYARLARTLDRRLLALLAAGQELHAAAPFGLDLAVANILGADFQRFDGALPQTLRGHVTLGLQPADILADLPAFLFARDFARARGYRLLLHLATADLLAVLPTDRLGLDLVQLGWPQAAALPADMLAREAGRLLLSEADSAAALAWGAAAGVRLFEGRAAVPGQSVAAA